MIFNIMNSVPREICIEINKAVYSDSSISRAEADDIIYDSFKNATDLNFRTIIESIVNNLADTRYVEEIKSGAKAHEKNINVPKLNIYTHEFDKFPDSDLVKQYKDRLFKAGIRNPETLSQCYWYLEQSTGADDETILKLLCEKSVEVYPGIFLKDYFLLREDYNEGALVTSIRQRYPNVSDDSAKIAGFLLKKIKGIPCVEIEEIRDYIIYAEMFIRTLRHFMVEGQLDTLTGTRDLESIIRRLPIPRNSKLVPTYLDAVAYCYMLPKQVLSDLVKALTKSLGFSATCLAVLTAFESGIYSPVDMLKYFKENSDYLKEVSDKIKSQAYSGKIEEFDEELNNYLRYMFTTKDEAKRFYETNKELVDSVIYRELTNGDRGTFLSTTFKYQTQLLARGTKIGIYSVRQLDVVYSSLYSLGLTNDEILECVHKHGDMLKSRIEVPQFDTEEIRV